jgi:hypothetical protein
MSDGNIEYLTGPDLDRRYKRSSQTRWRWSKDDLPLSISSRWS